MHHVVQPSCGNTSWIRRCAWPAILLWSSFEAVSVHQISFRRLLQLTCRVSAKQTKISEGCVAHLHQNHDQAKQNPKLRCTANNMVETLAIRLDSGSTVLAFVCERTGWSNKTVLNGALGQTAIRTGESAGPVKRDLKKLLSAPANSRGNIVERVLSLHAHVHDQTKPSCNYCQQADMVEALPSRLDLLERVGAAEPF